ncbi:hypothetical protein C8F04DRAFT_1094144 [Mycena alexandri]|uniref:Uncharacterized protein n=1 Tax=Mycena alexandri TaxID=1745969 RepID=A0AAD6T2H6_9AGAR|nr:hypothetical protein C8F04DRAFT_1094144 [Mycena alexandri]
MNHPYSGAAGYIYANEYPYTPVDARHNDPYSRMESFMPIQSVDSLPISHPYSPENTIWSTDNATSTYTQSQFSEDDQSRRVRRDSQRRLLPLRVPVLHPYGRQLDSWVDDDSVAEPETPAPKFPPAAALPTPRPKRSATTKGEAPVRRSGFVPYEPRASEERERERRLAAAWRRKIQKRVKRALRRLRRFLEAL